MPEELADLLGPLSIFLLLGGFLYFSYYLQKKATKAQTQAYNDYLKDSLSVLERNNEFMERIAVALEERNNGKQ